MSTSERRRRATPMAPEERRAAIVAATLPLLVEHGAEVSTRLIAEAAGIAEGTVFRAFPDKQALFRAVAESVLDPADGREVLAARLVGHDDLHAKVEVAAEALIARMQRGMVVMMALRSVLRAEDPPTRGRGRGRDSQPPSFVERSHDHLLTNLTDLVFAPHADQLRVEPRTAASVLRALVFGAWHPGRVEADDTFSPGDIADLLLKGVSSC